jgi:uncharacterized protein YndB with AHSA1/START domain
MSTFLGKLEHSLERDIVIRAPRALVFRYFSDSERWARWWGTGSTIDPRPGGAHVNVYPGGSRALGEVLAIEPPGRIVFTYGYEGGGEGDDKPIAPGGSRVTVELADHPDGTRLAFRHELASAAVRDLHVQGWRYHLALFANVVANEVFADATALADRWFGTWNEEDREARRAAIRAIVADDVVFRDAYSCTRGFEDLEAHVAGAKMHMPGITLERTGEARQCQGTVLVDRIAKDADGNSIGTGSVVFALAPDGRVREAVGFWT